MRVGCQLRVKLNRVHSVNEAIDFPTLAEFYDFVASGMVFFEFSGVVNVVCEDDILVCHFCYISGVTYVGTDKILGLSIGDFFLHFRHSEFDSEEEGDPEKFPNKKTHEGIDNIVVPCPKCHNFIDNSNEVTRCSMQIPHKFQSLYFHALVILEDFAGHSSPDLNRHQTEQGDPNDPVSHHRPRIEEGHVKAVGKEKEQNQSIADHEDGPAENGVSYEGNFVVAESGCEDGDVDDEGPGDRESGLVDIFLIVSCSRHYQIKLIQSLTQ